MRERLTRWWLPLVLLALVATIVTALAVAPTRTGDRGEHIAAQLRCPVCRSESVADSTATTAVEMRGQIDDFVAAGRSESWIIEHYEQRYGRWIRLAPPLAVDTWLLWAAPVLALLIGGWVVAGRRSSAPTTGEIDETERRRITLEVARRREREL